MAIIYQPPTSHSGTESRPFACLQGKPLKKEVTQMNRALFAIVACAALGTPAFAAMTDEECNAAWVAADANNDGTLDSNESARYLAALRVANMPADNPLTQTIFVENCKAGYFDISASAEAGAPFEGANSFTEGQAQDRIVAAGFANVSPLTKDAKGIWRGTADLQGKKVDVAVDYKGNVVNAKM